MFVSGQKSGTSIKDLYKTLFLLVLLTLSAYLMINGEGIISMIGISGFIVRALTGSLFHHTFLMIAKLLE